MILACEQIRRAARQEEGLSRQSVARTQCLLPSVQESAKLAPQAGNMYK
jgi:hypothetical protein